MQWGRVAGISTGRQANQLRIIVGIGAVIVGAVKLAQLYMGNEVPERRAVWAWIGLIVAGVVLVAAEVALVVMD